MTIEEITEMARQIFDIDVDRRGRETYVCDEYGLEAFAKLVEEKEREACAKMCERALATEYLCDEISFNHIKNFFAYAIRIREQENDGLAQKRRGA